MSLTSQPKIQKLISIKGEELITNEQPTDTNETPKLSLSFHQQFSTFEIPTFLLNEQDLTTNQESDLKNDLFSTFSDEEEDDNHNNEEDDFKDDRKYYQCHLSNRENRLGLISMRTNESDECILKTNNYFLFDKYRNSLRPILIKNKKLRTMKIIDYDHVMSKSTFLTNNKLFLEREIMWVDLPLLENDDRFVKVREIGAGGGWFLLTEQGKLYIYGKNSDHALGGNSTHYNEITLHPTLDSNLKIVDIQCGYLFAIIRTNEGTCYGSGYNCYVNIGIEGDRCVDALDFTKIERLEKKVRKHACGSFHSLFLTYDNEVYLCGLQNDGQLGFKQTDPKYNYSDCLSLTKLELNGITQFKSISAIGYASFLLGINNEIICTGNDPRKVFLPVTFPEEEENKKFGNLKDYLFSNKEMVEELKIFESYSLFKLSSKYSDLIGSFGLDRNQEVEMLVNRFDSGFFVLLLCKELREITKNVQYFIGNLGKCVANNNNNNGYFSDITMC